MPATLPTAEQLARVFHETYERMAPYYGYETRIGTREFDPLTINGKLMIATCEEVLRPFVSFFSDSVKWVPVAERLPDHAGECLVACSTGHVETLHFIPDVGWRDDGPSDGYWDKFVTHWMPLPEAPK